MPDTSASPVPLYVLGFIVAIVAVNYSGLLPIQLRFAHASLDALFVSLGAAILAVSLMRILAKAKEWGAFFVVSAFGAPTILFAFIITAGTIIGICTWVLNKESVPEFVSEVTVSNTHYRLYYENFSTTLRLRREFDIPIGIKAVSTLWLYSENSPSGWREEGERATILLSADSTVQIAQSGFVIASFRCGKFHVSCEQTR